MTSNFRLIGTRLAIAKRSDKTDGKVGPSERGRSTQFSPVERKIKDIHTTIVIGNNGTGKSHLFSAIAETFYYLSKGYVGTKLPLSYLHYRVDGRDVLIERPGRGKYNIFLDGVRTPVEDIPLPAKVIALTLTPFDKFPIPRRTSRDSATDPAAEIYHYLGTRDGTNRSSILSLLYRSIE